MHVWPGKSPHWHRGTLYLAASRTNMSRKAGLARAPSRVLPRGGHPTGVITAAQSECVQMSIVFQGHAPVGTGCTTPNNKKLIPNWQAPMRPGTVMAQLTELAEQAQSMRPPLQPESVVTKSTECWSKTHECPCPGSTLSRERRNACQKSTVNRNKLRGECLQL